MLISHINRYPVKGLRAETLKEVTLGTNTGLPGDRQFAITHQNSKVDYENPIWVPRRNFLVVAHSPLLASMSTRVDLESKILNVKKKGDLEFTVHLDSGRGMDKLSEYLTEHLGKAQTGPYKLVSAREGSFTDFQVPLVSLMNLTSLKVLENRLGEDLGHHRFRGNVWFHGEKAWEEFDWIGKIIEINGVILRPMKRIIRCAAIDTHPRTGQRDYKVTSLIKEMTGKCEFGILAEVLSPGLIFEGGRIEPRFNEPNKK